MEIMTSLIVILILIATAGVLSYAFELINWRTLVLGTIGASVSAVLKKAYDSLQSEEQDLKDPRDEPPNHIKVEEQIDSVEDIESSTKVQEDENVFDEARDVGDDS